MEHSTDPPPKEILNKDLSQPPQPTLEAIIDREASGMVNIVTRLFSKAAYYTSPEPYRANALYFIGQIQSYPGALERLTEVIFLFLKTILQRVRYVFVKATD